MCSIFTLLYALTLPISISIFNFYFFVFSGVCICCSTRFVAVLVTRWAFLNPMSLSLQRIEGSTVTFTDDSQVEADSLVFCTGREIHPLDPQPNRHSMLVPRVCAPRVTRWSLGRYWSRDLCSKQAAERLTGWLGIQTVILSRSDRLPRQRNLMMHALCPLPVYCSQVLVTRWASLNPMCLILQRKEGSTVTFTDDSQVEADSLVFCTGYKMSLP